MSQNIVFHDEFYSFSDDSSSRVFEVFPAVFSDDRGYFCEVLKTQNGWKNDDSIPIWFSGLDWIRQINRSKSHGKTIRGCHAQKSPFCQGKLVSALTTKIYDIITDTRPNSKTFGTSKVFILDSVKQNMLWVPPGFLHAFAVTSNDDAIFQYYCNNVFDKKSEVGIAPLSILPNVIANLEQLAMKDNKIANDFFDLFTMFKNLDSIKLSQKDLDGEDYQQWMNDVMKQYETSRKLWYR